MSSRCGEPGHDAQRLVDSLDLAVEGQRIALAHGADDGPGVVALGASLRLGVLEAMLRLLALADVLDLNDEMAGGARLIADQRDRDLGPDHGAAAASRSASRTGSRGSRPSPPAPAAGVRVDVVGVGDVLDPALEQLGLRPAGDGAEGGVDLHPAAVQADQRHPDRRLGEGGLEQFLGLAAGDLGLVRRSVTSCMVPRTQGRPRRRPRRPPARPWRWRISPSGRTMRKLASQTSPNAAWLRSRRTRSRSSGWISAANSSRVGENPTGCPKIRHSSSLHTARSSARRCAHEPTWARAWASPNWRSLQCASGPLDASVQSMPSSCRRNPS